MAMIRIKSAQDLLGGVMLIAVGFLGWWLVQDLPMGRLVRMGPAYTPSMIGLILVGFGVVISARGLLIEGPGLAAWAWRPLAIITSSIVAFGALLERAGLVAAALALVVIATLAAPDRRWGELAAFAVGLTVACVLIFKSFLGLPLQVWPL
jgi:putative tricarboxylic transport membrane protein